MNPTIIIGIVVVMICISISIGAGVYLSQKDDTKISSSQGSPGGVLAEKVEPAATKQTQAGNGCKSDINGGVCNEMKSTRCNAVMQGDGNVVVYSSGKSVWASNTNGKDSGPYRLVMQSDGNLVAYGAGGPIWASNTNGKGTGPYNAVMQDDCNFVVYDKTRNPLWASGTNGK